MVKQGRCVQDDLLLLNWISFRSQRRQHTSHAVDTCYLSLAVLTLLASMVESSIADLKWVPLLHLLVFLWIESLQRELQKMTIGSFSGRAELNVASIFPLQHGISRIKGPGGASAVILVTAVISATSVFVASWKEVEWFGCCYLGGGSVDRRLAVSQLWFFSTTTPQDGLRGGRWKLEVGEEAAGGHVVQGLETVFCLVDVWICYGIARCT